MRLFITYPSGVRVYRLSKEIKEGGRIVKTTPQTKDYPFRFEDFKSDMSQTFTGGTDSGYMDIVTKENNRPIDSIEIVYGKAEIHFCEKGNLDETIITIIKIHHNDPMVVSIPTNKCIYKIKALETPTILHVKRNYRRHTTKYSKSL